MAYIHLR